MTVPWMCSLHGGHSREFCDHGADTLEAMLERAVELGFTVFGVSEHAPRRDPRYLYPRETGWGWDVAKLDELFDLYAARVAELAERFADRLVVLRGFEAETVPEDDYEAVMGELRARPGLDYVVGSVHWLGTDLIPLPPGPELEALVARHGGTVPMMLTYYAQVARMVERLRPEVLGHIDLIVGGDAHLAALDSPPLRRAVGAVLERCRDAGTILDVNQGALRRGLPHPHPAPWIVGLARKMGVGFCFGDDSHSVEQVGEGLPEARTYLLDLGVDVLTTLTRRGGRIERIEVALR